MEGRGSGFPLKRFTGLPGDGPTSALARFTRRRPQAAPGERCEMCGEPIPEDHRHVVNVESRTLLCTCTACALLFTHEGAALGKYRAVPDRYLYDPSLSLSPAQWDALQIPVGLAFFFQNSQLGRWVAFYPSPGGATESLLDLGAWTEILDANPALASAAPDVEAILVRRVGEQFEGYLLPIDACYELVGRVRRSWKGFAGGEEAWREIEAFFTSVRARSRRVRPEAEDG